MRSRTPTLLLPALTALALGVPACSDTLVEHCASPTLLA